MSDTTATLILAAVLGCLLLVLAAIRVVRTWWRLRAPRLVTCPETKAPAAVTIDAMGSLLTSPFGGPSLWLDDCSRWPSRRFCGQECLPQISAAPDDCRVDTIARRWFASKTCVIAVKQSPRRASFRTARPCFSRTGRRSSGPTCRPSGYPRLSRRIWRCAGIVMSPRHFVVSIQNS